MDDDAKLPGVLIQPVGVSSKILVGGEADLSTIAALNDVLRYARAGTPWVTGPYIVPDNGLGGECSVAPA